MSAPDPSQLHPVLSFITTNADAIVTGAAVLVLSFLRVLGRKDTAQTAIDVIKEKPLTHAEVDLKLLKCQVKVQDNINESLAEFRKELLKEIRILHVRLNKEEQEG